MSSKSAGNHVFIEAKCNKTCDQQSVCQVYNMKHVKIINLLYFQLNNIGGISVLFFSFTSLKRVSKSGKNAIYFWPFGVKISKQKYKNKVY